MNIVTSICVDTDDAGSQVNYPSLGKHKIHKREIYWRCVTTFCLTSLKFNPDQKHLVFTNDESDIVINNYDVKKNLADRGVEFKYLKFDRYDPDGHAKSFRNAFYKHEVINALAGLTVPSLLLDSDCIWTGRNNELFKILEEGRGLLLQDTYQRSANPDQKSPHNLSMSEMAEVFNKISINRLRKKYPIWFGGELIGASPEQFKIIGEQILKTLDYCKLNSIEFSNGDSIFANDEYVSSYVYNSLNFNVIDTCNKYSKRLYTRYKINNLNKKDINLVIWHLPNEKNTGLKQLFYDIIKPGSGFWKDSSDPKYYLGSFVGIPESFSDGVMRMMYLPVNKGKNFLRPLIKAVKQ
jgi:hypothetical protein